MVLGISGQCFYLILKPVNVCATFLDVGGKKVPSHCISEAYFKQWRGGKKLLGYVTELTRLNYNSKLWQMFGLHAWGITTLQSLDVDMLSVCWKKTVWTVTHRHWQCKNFKTTLLSFSSFISGASNNQLNVHYVYLDKCLSPVREVEGQSAQPGQYLKRLYEIQSFMTVRRWGRCSMGAADEDNKLPG